MDEIKTHLLAPQMKNKMCYSDYKSHSTMGPSDSDREREEGANSRRKHRYREREEGANSRRKHRYRERRGGTS